MNINVRKYFAFFLASVTPFAVSANPGNSADELVAVGMSALRQIDQGQIEPLWDKTSAVVKSVRPKQSFVEEIQRARARLGAVQVRTWAGIQRIEYLPGSSDPPPGLYANVDYSTRLLDGRMVYEKVSMRLEPDGWRVVGYVPRENP